MKRARKYATGGDNSLMSEDEQMFGTEELAEAKARPKFQETSKYKVRDVSKDAKAKGASAEKSQDDIDKMSFKQAFAYKKNKGKAFTWRGKKYTTEMASDKKKSEPSKSTASKPSKGMDQTDPGYIPRSKRSTDPGDIGDRTPSKAMTEATKKKPRRDMTNFASMSFEEQMEYLRTKGRENMGAKTKMAKGGVPAKKAPAKMMLGGMTRKYNMGGIVKANCGASMKPSGGSRKK